MRLRQDILAPKIGKRGRLIIRLANKVDRLKQSERINNLLAQIGLGVVNLSLNKELAFKIVRRFG